MMKMVPVSERCPTGKLANKVHLHVVKHEFSVHSPIRAGFVGRVCGMVQGKTNVIAAGNGRNGEKEYNCDNDYENQHPISKQYTISNTLTVGASKKR